MGPLTRRATADRPSAGARLRRWALGALLLLATGPGLVARAQTTGPSQTRFDLVALDGPPSSLESVRLELAISREGVPVRAAEPPRLSFLGAEPEGPLEPTLPGRWQQRVRLGAGESLGAALIADVEFQGVASRLELSLREWPEPPLGVPAITSAVAGTAATVRIPIEARHQQAADEIGLVLPEGQLLGVQAEDGGLRAEWRLLDDPLPRALPYLVLDRSRPRSAPAWGVLRLVGRPRIPVETTPGAQVTVEVGGRRYGPFRADARGVATALVEVEPGESTAEVQVVDELGGQQRARISLGAASGPALVLAAEGAIVAGQPLPDLFIAAVGAAGQPWRGDPPSCRTATGQVVPTSRLREGLWRAALPAGSEGLIEVRVECQLGGQGRASTRLQVDASTPSALRLRMWPETLSADQPTAQLQAWLEGPMGDRLDASGIVLGALRGQLTEEEGSPAMRVASYDGRGAVEAGEDLIEARWQAPAGSGPTWRLGIEALGPRRADGALPVRVRAWDRAGRPLAGVSLELRQGGEALRLRTDASGSAAAELPAEPSRLGPFLLVARTDAVEARRVLFTQDFDDARPDASLGLTVQRRVELRGGQVRRIALRTEPSSIRAGGGQSARVQVELLDQGNHPVAAEAPALTATRARLGPPQPVGEGRYEAELVPDSGLSYGEIRVEASSVDGSMRAETRLLVEPRALRLAVGPSFGGILGGDGALAGLGGAELDWAPRFLPTDILLRGAVESWSRRYALLDDRTDEAVELRTTWVSLGGGLVFRRERGRLALAGGLLAYAVPFSQGVRYGDRDQTRASGLAGPGVEPVLSLAWRLGPGELQVQGGYLWLSMPAADVSYAGLVGGVRPRVSWRLLF